MFGRLLDDDDIAREAIQPELDALKKKLETEEDPEVRRQITERRERLLALLLEQK